MVKCPNEDCTEFDALCNAESFPRDTEIICGTCQTVMVWLPEDAD